MLSLLTQRLALYVYADATPDQGIDNPTYTFQAYAWGRVEPRTLGLEKTTAGGAVAHSEAIITLRDQITLAVFSLVIDPTGTRWRITGSTPRQMRNLVQYTADLAPQFATVATVYGP